MPHERLIHRVASAGLAAMLALAMALAATPAEGVDAARCSAAVAGPPSPAVGYRAVDAPATGCDTVAAPTLP